MTSFADLPTEILDVIGDYLDTGGNSFKPLTLVSSRFYHHFSQRIWRHIAVHSHTPPEFISILKDHAHLVRSILFKGRVQKEYYEIHFPGILVFEHDNTVRIIAKANQVCRYSADFFRLNPTIQDVIITPRDLRLNEQFWNAIFTSLQNPRRLQLGREGAIMKVFMESGSGRAFWRACGRFEQVDYMGWDQSRALTKDGRFDCSRLRRLNYAATGSPKNMSGLWRWMGRCSNLIKLHWGGQVPILHVRANAEPPVWSHLEDLSLGDVRGTDETLARVVLTYLPPSLKHLRVESATFGPESFGILRERVFGSLRTLSVRGCRLFRSPMVLEVLQKCPRLEELDAYCIITKDLREHPGAWTCTGLTALRVNFKSNRGEDQESGDDDEDNDDDHLLFEHLSTLTHLEELDMSRCPETYAGLWFLPSPETGPQLRLESGLDQLLTLTRLKKVKFSRTVQNMKDVDVEWMLESWPKLEELSGAFSTDANTEKELSALVRGQGIVV